MDYEKLKELAIETGFTHVGKLDADTIELRKEVRDMCEENSCGAYGTKWSCPPACGDLDECTSNVRKYKEGLILQTSTELEDSFDIEGMEAAGKKHNKTFAEYYEKVKQLYPNAMALGAGGCTKCKVCTYPDEPCRFPDLMTSSMEAYGMVVSDVCKANDIPYYYGPNTLTYVGCMLID